MSYRGKGNPQKIIFYDANCKFCVGVIDFFIRNDKKKILQYKPFQDKESKEILKAYGIVFVSLFTIYFIQNEKVFTKSNAIINIIQNLPFPLNMISILKFIPTRLSDLIYSWVAKNRYKF